MASAALDAAPATDEHDVHVAAPESHMAVVNSSMGDNGPSSVPEERQSGEHPPALEEEVKSPREACVSFSQLSESGEGDGDDASLHIMASQMSLSQALFGTESDESDGSGSDDEDVGGGKERRNAKQGDYNVSHRTRSPSPLESEIKVPEGGGAESESGSGLSTDDELGAASSPLPARRKLKSATIGDHDMRSDSSDDSNSDSESIRPGYRSSLLKKSNNTEQRQTPPRPRTLTSQQQKVSDKAAAVADEEKRAVLEADSLQEKQEYFHQKLESLRPITNEELEQAIQEEQEELLSHIQSAASKRLQERFDQDRLELHRLKSGEEPSKNSEASLEQPAAAEEDSKGSISDTEHAYSSDGSDSSEDEEEEGLEILPDASPAFSANPPFETPDTSSKSASPAPLALPPPSVEKGHNPSKSSTFSSALGKKGVCALNAAYRAREDLKRQLRLQCLRKANDRWAKQYDHANSEDLLAHQKESELMRMKAALRGGMKAPATTPDETAASPPQQDDELEADEKEGSGKEEQETSGEPLGINLREQAKAAAAVVSEELNGMAVENSTSTSTEVPEDLHDTAVENMPEAPCDPAIRKYGVKYGHAARVEEAKSVMQRVIMYQSKNLSDQIEGPELDSQALATDPESQVVDHGTLHPDVGGESSRAGKAVKFGEILHREEKRGAPDPQKDAPAADDDCSNGEEVEKEGTSFFGQVVGAGSGAGLAGADSEKSDEGRDESAKEVPARDRNAAYRELLQAEARELKKARKLRKTGMLDDKAEEEEEEERIKGLGDYGFGISTKYGAGKDKEEDDYKAEKICEDDLNHIVDSVSDDEGDAERAEEMRKRQEIAEDKEQMKEMMRQVKGGFSDMRMGGRSSTARGAYRMDQLTAADRSSRREAKRLGLANSDEEFSSDEEEESDGEMDEQQLAEQVKREQQLRHLGYSDAVIQDLEEDSEDDGERGDENGETSTGALGPAEDEEARATKKWLKGSKYRRWLREHRESQRISREESSHHSVSRASYALDEDSRDLERLLSLSSSRSAPMKRSTSEATYSGILTEDGESRLMGLGMVTMPAMKRSKSSPAEAADVGNSGSNLGISSDSPPPPIQGFAGVFAGRSSCTSFMSRKQGSIMRSDHHTTITSTKFVFMSDTASRMSCEDTSSRMPGIEKSEKAKSSSSKSLTRKPSGRMWASMFPQPEKVR